MSVLPSHLLQEIQGVLCSEKAASKKLDISSRTYDLFFHNYQELFNSLRQAVSEKVYLFRKAFLESKKIISVWKYIFHINSHYIN